MGRARLESQFCHSVTLSSFLCHTRAARTLVAQDGVGDPVSMLLPPNLLVLQMSLHLPPVSYLKDRSPTLAWLAGEGDLEAMWCGACQAGEALTEERPRGLHSASPFESLVSMPLEILTLRFQFNYISIKWNKGTGAPESRLCEHLMEFQSCLFSCLPLS